MSRSDALSPRRTESVGIGLVRTARPRQWLKNVLVFAAPGAAGVLDVAEPLGRTCAAFLLFCVASAGTYLLNDARDVAVDRLHPTKRTRPVAAGSVSVSTAALAGVVLIVIAVAGAFAVRWQLGATITGYLALTTAYTLFLKGIAPLDLVAVASGFVLRSIAGAAATGVPISDWFFIVASFGSLFMVAGKRSGESSDLGDGAGDVRATLGEYTTTYLGYVRAVASGVVLVAYCLWAFEKAAEFDPTIPWFQLTIPPFAVGVLRYAMLVDLGKGASPEELVLEDRILLVAGMVWAAVFALGVYST